MNILVTGGTGFLGRHVVWRLAALGHAVTFTGRRDEEAKDIIERSANKVQYAPLAHGESGSAQAMVSLAKGMDAIVHCAALSSPWGSAKAFHQANVLSTREVIAACDANDIKRLVHLSTPSLYFDFNDRLDVRESDPLPALVNNYARSKAAAEQLLAKASIPEMVILRPRAIFGPWDNTLMPRLLRVMERAALPIIRGGNAQLDITYVDNLVDVIVLALLKPLPRQLNVYNVSNGDPHSLNQLLEKLSSTFNIPLRTRKIPWWLISCGASALEAWAHLSQGKEPPMTRYSAGVLAFSQTLNLDAVKDELGYQPKISIDEGLSRHAAWLSNQQPRVQP